MSIQTGDVVRARESTWRVTGLRCYAQSVSVSAASLPAVHVVRLTGVEASNRARDCTLLTPFDEVERVGAVWAPRVVSRRRWMRALAGLLAEAQPRAAPQSIVGADVSLHAYQLDPLLMLLRGSCSRVLVADEVGLGKTVQAAVLVRELRERGCADRVLVLVPAGLRDQWREELRDRVRLSARVVDASWQSTIGRELPADVNPWSLPGLYLSSLDYIKQPDVLRVLTRVRWDVVVVDEAHTLAAGSERRAAAGRVAERAAFVVLLTATPHSGSAADFEALRTVGAIDGDPLAIFRRTRLDVGRGGGGRRVHVLRVRLSPDERRMHELLSRYVRVVERRTRPGDGARLAMVVLRKRACSSAWSLARSVSRRWQLIAEQASAAAAECLAEQIPLPFWPRAPGVGEEEGDEEPGGVLEEAGLPVRHERAWLSLLGEVARRAARAEGKVRALARLLRRVVRAGESAVVFTEYRDTLVHLASRIDRAAGVAQLHGGLGAEARRYALQRFSSGEARVLLATDAAGEGLNLQRRCRVVVQVELPWNPTRVEQRIGRVDRIGQARVVHAWQFVSAGTYEQRVRDALSARLERIAEAFREDGGVSVCAGVSDEATGIAARLRLLRSVGASTRERTREARAGPRRRTGSRRLSGSRQLVERSPPWVSIVGRAERRPFREWAPGLICLWRVRLRSADGALVETRVVALRLELDASAWACGWRGGSRLSDIVAASREEMARVVDVEARRVCVDVWACESPWRERRRARETLIDERMRRAAVVQVQAELFPDVVGGEKDEMGAWGVVRDEERRRTRGDGESGVDSLSIESALMLVLVLAPGA